jgi:hypothetical protein
MYKPGGTCAATPLQLAGCIGAAQQRHKELHQQLQEALAAAQAGQEADADMEG